MTTLGWTCHTRAAPSCDMFSLGSSYFHVALTTVRHLLTADNSKRASRTLSPHALVWHVQPRVVIFPCRTHYRPSSVIVVWPTTSCFADWSKRRHVTLRIIDCQEVVLTCYRIFTTCHPLPRDMSTHVTWKRVTCCKYSTKMKSRVRFPADH